MTAKRVLCDSGNPDFLVKLRNRISAWFWENEVPDDSRNPEFRDTRGTRGSPGDSGNPENW